jgi:hypothetical protein
LAKTQPNPFIAKINAYNFNTGKSSP